jgi:DNA-binding GntR family transcriptional regulator
MTLTIKNKTLSAAISDQLRQQILGGEHASGAQLRQDALATAYGVSRIPVREALFQLEAEGLVQIVPHKGAVVSGLSPEEIDDVFELRQILEPRLLTRSIPALTQADFDALAAIQAAFVSAVAARDPSQWGVLNARLHLTMYGRAQLPRTQNIVAGLLQTSERYTRLQLASPAAWARAQQEHDALIRLCQAGDADAACRLLRTHIGQVHADLLAMIPDRPGKAG